MAALRRLALSAGLLLALVTLWSVGFAFYNSQSDAHATAKLRQINVLRADVPTSIVTPTTNKPTTAKPNQKTRKPDQHQGFPGLRSVLHPRTVDMQPRSGDRQKLTPTADQSPRIISSTKTFAQYGRAQRGVHHTIENRMVLDEIQNRQDDALLVMIVLNDNSSWGANRTLDDGFQLLGNFTYPKHKTSLTMLTSSMDEFAKIQQRMLQEIDQYAQFSLLYRDDFNMEGLNRSNRHDESMQAARRRMLARYRNYALLSTLQPWHEHVVWLDADVHVVPPELVKKMVHADRDILEPLCFSGTPPSRAHEYDLNAWTGIRRRSGAEVRHMGQYQNGKEEFMPLDSVGGTMLYVRADVHRQGVLFPHHYTIGNEWDQEGYDGIETEGLCYSAHFLGFRCFGMPHEVIYHV